jgi:hypothetical protein
MCEMQNAFLSKTEYKIIKKSQKRLSNVLEVKRKICTSSFFANISFL